MGRDWLIADVGAFLWRAFHGYARGDPTAALVGAVRDVEAAAAKLEIADVAWAFDRGPYKRAAHCPGYKAKRHEQKLTDAEAAARDELRAHGDRLRTKLLAVLGYGNVLSAAGYEADDLMAAAVAGLPPGDRAVLATRDADLFQLLSGRCAVYNPHTGALTTANTFRAEHGIPPRLWAEVKAVAGCSSDGVLGCAGVAEAGALTFFRGELAGTKKHEKILAYNRSPEYAAARRLVALPYEGTPAVALTPDPPRPADGWARVCDILGVPPVEDESARRRACRLT